MIPIAIGADEAGDDLKEKLKGYLKGLNLAVTDYGVFDTEPVFYPNIARKVAQAIMAGKHERGILICGTGIGMAISANQVSGIRAAVCHDLSSVDWARNRYHAQIIALGARIIGEEPAKLLVSAWLRSESKGMIDPESITFF